MAQMVTWEGRTTASEHACDRAGGRREEERQEAKKGGKGYSFA